MRRMTMSLVLAVVLAASAAGAQVPPPPPGIPEGSVVPVGGLVVGYIEVAHAQADSAARLLKALRARSAADPGFVSMTVLRRITHPNHFMLLEEWQDNAAREAHAAQPHVLEARAALQAIAVAPYDERPHRPLAAGQAKPAPPGAVHAVTHVDFVPVYREEGEAGLRRFAEAARGQPGNLRFDVLSQASRPNHMTIVEVWPNVEDTHRHAGAQATREFRGFLLPRSGSIYDERLYREEP